MPDEPFDLDALESEGKPFPFRHGGEDYELPPSIDLRVALAEEAGKIDEALRLLLGTEQWDRIVASEAVFDSTKFVALMEAYKKHLGVAAGESLASSPSSGSTGGPSKRTSKRTTALR